MNSAEQAITRANIRLLEGTATVNGDEPLDDLIDDINDLAFLAWILENDL